MASKPIRVPPGMELVRATDLCRVCDSTFTDELVVRFASRAIPGGFGYIELRHLDEPELSHLWRSRPVHAARAHEPR